MAFLTDTHCHLNLNTFQDDLDAVIDRARESGVQRILIPGIDLPTSRLAVDLAERYAPLYAAVGVHPSDALSWDEHSLSQLRELAQSRKVVAIGEIGLDYYRDHAPRELQRQVLLQQLELAGQVELPVSIHNRDSFTDLWELISGWQADLARSGSKWAGSPGVFHSFDGLLAEAKQVIEHGFFLGVSGPLTFTNAKARQESFAQLPLANLLVETDAPYLTPHPHRGKRNEPSYIPLIVNKIADLHQIEYDKVAQETSANAARLFVWGADI